MFHKNLNLEMENKMMAHEKTLSVRTTGKGTYEITSPVAEFVRQSQIQTGQVCVFMQHTSASLVIYENADPSAQVDLKNYFERLVPESADYFTHTLEGPDDMTSHLRMVLTRTSETIPVSRGKMTLGTWQGIFIFEHRRAPHQRLIRLSIVGV